MKTKKKKTRKHVCLFFQDEMWSAIDTENDGLDNVLHTDPSYEGITAWAKRNGHNVVCETGIETESFEDYIRATNFRQLKKQKTILVKLTMGKKLNKNEIEELNGLLNFLDGIQDMAVDLYGFEKKRIFPKK